MSGHTHGGQVVFPVIGAPILPSHFGQKYLHGLVQGPKTQVYVSRGLGTISPPLRFCAPPELTVLELQSPA
jgi:predicted MPP superfamily phosphohydrolase